MKANNEDIRLVKVGIKNLNELVDLQEMPMPEGWDEVPAVLKL